MEQDPSKNGIILMLILDATALDHFGGHDGG